MLPEVVAKDVHFDPKEPEQLRNREDEGEQSPYGFLVMVWNLPKGATEKTLKDRLGPLEEKVADIERLKRRCW